MFLSKSAPTMRSAISAEREKRVQPRVFYDYTPGKTDYRAASKSISNSGLEDALEFPVDFNSE
jgi:hypothetical protein